MTVTFGDVVFDTVEYDAESDILVLRVPLCLVLLL